MSVKTCCGGSKHVDTHTPHWEGQKRTGMYLPNLHCLRSGTRGAARLGLRQVDEIESKHRVWSILEFSPEGTQRRIEPVPPS